MRKLISFFFLLFILFVFSSSSVAAYTKCYMGTTEVGHMHAYFDDDLTYPIDDGPLGFGRRTMDFIVNGKYAAVEFWIDKDYINYNDPEFPAFKLGNSDWLAKNYVWSRVENWNGGIRYIAWFEVPDDNLCGPCWANVGWRSIVDGQVYYCSDLTYKYKADGYYVDYITTSCMNNPSGCELIHSGARKAYFPEGYYFTGTISNANYCGSFKLCLDNGIYSQCGLFQFYGDNNCIITAGAFEWSVKDKVRFYISPNEQNPPPVGVSLTIASAYSPVYFFDFISDNYCGGNMGGGVAPTPTPSSVCPLSLQQTESSGSGTPLENRYDSDQYTLFTSNKTGYIDKAEIYVYLSATDPNAGARGNKILTCRITNASGGNILGESLPNDGPFYSQNTWVPVYFNTPVNVTKNKDYRLYCKVESKAGGGWIYWLDFYNNKTNKTRKIYICPACPTCPSTVTHEDVPRGDGKFNKVISWSNVQYEEGYKIYLCSTTNPFETCTPTYLTSVGANVTSYTATNGNQGFAPGAKVIYEIKPFNSQCNELSCEWKENNVPFFLPTPTPTPTPSGITPTPPTPTPTPSENAWFQTQEGNVYAHYEILSKVPQNQYFSLIGEGGFPGVVYFGNDEYFGLGEVSSMNWLVNTSFKNYLDYDYFYELLGSPEYQVEETEEISLPLEARDLILAYDGDFKTASSWDIGSRKIVVLVKGKLLIKDPISVGNGGSLMVITKNGIGISKNLTSLDGLFFTDDNFYSSVEEDFEIGFDGKEFIPVNSDKQLIINGGVYAGNFFLERNLGLANENTPSERFIYRPDFLLNLHPLLWIRARLWQEEIP